MNNDCTTFNESNFDLLPSQSNVYGVTCIEGRGNVSHNTVLVALMKGKIYSCEYHKTSNHPDIQGIGREVSFTYIPGKCCLISIDSFCCAARGLIIGVTFSNDSDESFLNIYCNYGEDISTGQEWNLDNVAQTCRSFDLKFTPYQLTHCKVQCPVDKLQRTIFILAGDDQQFHAYAQHKGKAVFSEVNTKDYLVELGSALGIPTYLNINTINEDHRVTVVGYVNGAVQAFLVRTNDNTIQASWSVEHDSPISELKVILPSAGAQPSSKECVQGEMDNGCETSNVHLCVVSSREPAAVYRNVLNLGFSSPVVLTDSSLYDVATSCTFFKNHILGQHEIVIGTYGQKLLAYNLDRICDPNCSKISPSWSRWLAHPILKVRMLDMTGDGMQEMMVLTTNGVHVFQYNMGTILDKVKSYLKIKSKA